jgi:PleD family two-component response regulator
VVLAEKIRRAVAAIEYELPHGRTGPASEVTDLSMTVSVGVGMHRVGIDTEAVFDAADSALYTAKLSGKNRVELNYPGGVRRAP